MPSREKTQTVKLSELPRRGWELSGESCDGPPDPDDVAAWSDLQGWSVEEDKAMWTRPSQRLEDARRR